MKSCGSANLSSWLEVPAIRWSPISDAPDGTVVRLALLLGHSPKVRAVAAVGPVSTGTVDENRCGGICPWAILEKSITTGWPDRSEGRRVGKECVRTCHSWWWLSELEQKRNKHTP